MPFELWDTTGAVRLSQARCICVKAEPRRFNLHMTQWGGGFWLDPLFRDILRTHPETARQYEDLKRDLMTRLASDPPAYNAGKTSFIESIAQRARCDQTDTGRDSDVQPV